jgi:hypothetical protein
MSSIQPAISELERAYRELKPLFPDGIPGDDPVVTIQPSRSGSSLGALTPCAWENQQGREVNEISIAAEHLAGSVEDIMGTLLHEMVHHANALKGVADGSGPRGYHTRVFRDLARAVGLTVECDGRHGWAITRLGAKARRAVLRFKPQKHAFEMFRKRPEPHQGPTKMRKWSCGCTTVRCATDLRATCEECGQRFERECVPTL